jgi:hypothetical protein
MLIPNLCANYTRNEQLKSIKGRIEFGMNVVRTNVRLLAIILILSACSARIDSTPSASTITLAPKPSLSATTPSTEIATVVADATADHVDTPTIQPLPAECSEGLLAYTMVGQGDYSTLSESGVYAACADGTFQQRIVQFEVASVGFFTLLSPDHLAAFQDGTKLVLSAN